MKTISLLTLVCVAVASSVALAYAAGPSDDLARNAFKEILSQADTNKDGKLSVTECRSIFKDPAMAKKNCSFWDANHDGTITADEYVNKAMSSGLAALLLVTWWIPDDTTSLFVRDAPAA